MGYFYKNQLVSWSRISEPSTGVSSSSQILKQLHQEVAPSSGGRWDKRKAERGVQPGGFSGEASEAMGWTELGVFSVVVVTGASACNPQANSDRLGKLSSKICVSDIGGFVGFHVT